jgi:uncharacterized protein (TIGR03067 family)
MTPLLILVAVILTAGFAPAPRPKPSRSEADLKELQGAWVLVTITGEGGQAIEKAGALRLVIEGDRAKNYRGEMSSEYALTLDASPSPKRYVFKPVGRARTEPVSRGIYSVGGGTLKFCTDGPGEAPPRAFEGPRAGTFLYVYKRQD